MSNPWYLRVCAPAMVPDAQPPAKDAAAAPGTDAAPASAEKPSFVVNRNNRSPAQKLTPRIDNVPLTPLEPGYVRLHDTSVDFEIGNGPKGPRADNVRRTST